MDDQNFSLKKTIETVQSLRLKGAPISSSIINATAKELSLPMTECCLLKMVGTYLSVIAEPETFAKKWNEMVKR